MEFLKTNVALTEFGFVIPAWVSHIFTGCWKSQGRGPPCSDPHLSDEDGELLRAEA